MSCRTSLRTAQQYRPADPDSGSPQTAPRHTPQITGAADLAAYLRPGGRGHTVSVRRDRLRRPLPGSHTFRFASALLTFALVAGACSPTEDEGDVTFFCTLLSDGVGITETASSPLEFEALMQVAPPEIRDTVAELRFAAVELDEVSDDDLSALFAARFSPTAAGARDRLVDYAGSTCGLDLSAGPPPGFEALRAELEEFLAVGAAGRPWLEQIRVDPATVAGQLHSVQVSFLTSPGDPAHADEVCTNVSGWAYGQRAAAGSVTVEFDGQVLSQRSGPNGICTS